MKIAHVSDLHSFLIPVPEEADTIAISGDFLPNMTRDFYDDYGKIEREKSFQREWVRQNLERIKRWANGRKIIFSSGNHDFINPTIQMRHAGIDAVCVDLERYEYQGIIFYGFPFVPLMAGEWNFECDIEPMGQHIRRLRDALSAEPRVDVLLAHCPPYGVLDCRIATRDAEGQVTFVDQHDGNKQLSNLLSYIEEWSLPQFLLCGHFHASYGIVEEFGITISNAATKMNLFEVTNESHDDQRTA